MRCGKVIRVRQVLWNPYYWMELNGSLNVFRYIDKVVNGWRTLSVEIVHQLSF